MDPWGKLDGPLEDVYDRYREARELGATAGEASPETDVVSVLMQFTGELADIEARGFRTRWSTPEAGLARGELDLADLPELATHPGVVQLGYGEEDEPLLDTSVPEIRARGTPGGSPHVWSVDTGTGAFTGPTGSGVVIGVIDSGIDFEHPTFLRTSSPKATRIRRIWDAGLSPTGGESSPAAALLGAGFTYGVEYTDSDIDAVLQGSSGAAPVRHRDCGGHGTHVASIVAGDGREGGLLSSDYDLVGVGPGADLVVVKIFHLENDPTRPGGGPVSFQDRLEHAVSYIEEVARTQLGDPPVVINFSGGSSLGPHDGLTTRDLWLRSHYAGASGKAFVTSAGNSAGKRQHALVTVPGGGTVDVPFELYDTRTVKTDRKKCTRESNTRTLHVDLWYPDIAPATLSLSLKVPSSSSFVAGPAIGDPNVSGTHDGGKRYVIRHSSTSAVRPPGTPVTRNNVRVSFEADGDDHATGTYELRIAAPAGTEVHAWCYRYTRHGVRVHGSAPADADVDDEGTVGTPGSAANVITVAAYDDTSGSIAGFSSRGPLVDYSGSGPLVDKPDLGAPGVSIDAAQSDHSLSPIVRGVLSPSYEPKNGTSMSAPHVAGVVALMLEKNDGLASAAIRSTLAGEARAASPPEEFGAGKVDAKDTHDAVP